MPRISVELAVFVAVAAVALVSAPGGPGWESADGVVAAARLTRVTGHGPGATLLGGLATLVPVGELAFRVALVGALALAAAAAGVVALVRALTPRAVGAGAVAAALIAVTPAAAGSLATGEAALTAALVVWALVAVVRAARADTGERPAPVAALGAAAAAGALVAVAPLAAALVAALVAAGPGRRAAGATRALMAAAALVVAALLIVPLALRAADPALAGVAATGWASLLAPRGGAAIGDAVHALGSGGGAVAILAGMIGLGLGALTGLRGAAAVLVAGLALVAGALAARDPSLALAAIAVLAAGLGPLATAAARLGPERARETIATLAAVPVAVVAAVAPRPDGGARADRDALARVAADVAGALDPGPGLVMAVEPAVSTALGHEQLVAGLRPDLAVARRDRAGTSTHLLAVKRARPELYVPRIDDRVAGGDAERLVVTNLRRGLVVGSDAPGFGALDRALCAPAGRGFSLALTDPGDTGAKPAPPADYPGAGGRALASYLGVQRGLREAVRGHLGDAARAAGLVGRFDAADIALLAATVVEPARPALYGFVPLPSEALPPTWLADLFGDDLAWVAGIREPELPTSAPLARRLHARWRAILSGTAPPDDPEVAALGLDATRATVTMLADLGRVELAERAARALLADHEDAATLLVLGSILAERGGLEDRERLDDARRAALTEAETVLGRAAVARRDDVDALIVRGLVQARLGRPDDARQTWLAADRIAPGRADIRDLLERFAAPGPD